MAVAERIYSNNARVIPITAHQRFKQAGVIDLVIPQVQLHSEQAVCALCGYGASTDKRWYPIMAATSCPVCGSQKKK